MYHKEIVYDRETRDYAMYLDGKLVGYARTYHEAEVTLDQLVFDLLNGDYFRTTNEIDCACGNVAVKTVHATPSLSQAIALGLVGAADPICEKCGATAFVWCDGQMFCKEWWQQGACQLQTTTEADTPIL